MIEKLVFLLLTDSQVINLFILLFTAFQDPPQTIRSLHYYTVLYIIRIRTKVIYWPMARNMYQYLQVTNTYT
jgi:hypothetical protein